MPTKNEKALVSLIEEMFQKCPQDAIVYLLKAVLSECGGECRDQI